MEIHVDDHPLLGGLVDFLDNPKFEGRNDILTSRGRRSCITNKYSNQERLLFNST